jgi:hypothetical protein
MTRFGLAFMAALAVAVAAPADGSAQTRSGERDGNVWDVITGRRDYPDARSPDARYPDTRDRRTGVRGGGPPFCQNGQGHPVHGRQWCRDKGFGDSRAQRDWGDVILRPRRDSRLDQGGLIDVLGDVVFGRVQQRSHALGARGPLVGSWVSAPDGGQMLSIRSGSLTIAELVDANRDGHVDYVRLRRQW